ncbi:MAG: PaaI family thioesterase [Campylobacterota bacterium]|nr:PaaI family thioesterase [Campylobacterota bacterium]
MAEKIENSEEDVNIDNKVYLETHLKINHALSGDIEELKDGYAKIVLSTTEDMRADDAGLVHGGFIFSAADFSAMAAVNDKNVVLAASTCQFLAPVRVRDLVVFEATVRHKEGRKRNIHVKGYSSEVKVFEGEFKTVITEHHVLNLSLVKNSQELEES